LALFQDFERGPFGNKRPLGNGHPDAGFTRENHHLLLAVLIAERGGKPGKPADYDHDDRRYGF
jgi:hypothetical protein